MSWIGRQNPMPDKSLRTGMVQFLKFNAVGLLNTLIDFVIFTLLNSLGLIYTAAQVISYSAGTANSFILNKKVTFKDRDRGSKERFDRLQLLKFIGLNLLVLGISLVLMHLLTDSFGIQVIVAKIMVTFVTVVINFYGSRKWVF